MYCSELWKSIYDDVYNRCSVSVSNIKMLMYQNQCTINSMM